MGQLKNFVYDHDSRSVKAEKGSQIYIWKPVPR